MKRKLYFISLIGASFLFFACSEDNMLTPTADEPVLEQSEQVGSVLKGAKKPAAKLVGITDCAFTFTPPTFWNGTVDFGEMGVFGLTFISHEPPRDYSQASPFYEDFIIYEQGTNGEIPENVLIKGWNKGVVTFANKVPEDVNFLANGKITEAYGPFVLWDGCNSHLKGLVSYPPEGGLPERAVGVLRLN
jgi:hypothetical protein